MQYGILARPHPPCFSKHQSGTSSWLLITVTLGIENPRWVQKRVAGYRPSASGVAFTSFLRIPALKMQGTMLARRDRVATAPSGRSRSVTLLVHASAQQQRELVVPQAKRKSGGPPVPINCAACILGGGESDSRRLFPLVRPRGSGPLAELAG